LIDKAGGGSVFKVAEGNGTTARDLNLLAEAKTATINGVETKVIDGTSTYHIELSNTDTLQDLVDRINGATGRVRASIFNDGSTVKPFRFTLFNQSSGKAGELLWDTSETTFTLDESVHAQDALLQIGAPGTGGVIASSPTNVFTGVLPDVTLTVKGASDKPVTVSVGATDSGVVKELTRYDETTQTAAVLQGDGRVLRVDIDLNNLVSGRITGAGLFQSLEAVGISVKNDGTLELNEEKLKQRFAQNPADVTEFFSKKETGLSARFDKLVEQLAGIGDTVLVGRVGTLTRKIEQNQGRIDLWNARLDKQRDQLLKSFQQSETIIAKLQSSLSALNAIAPLPALQRRGS
jgi:flagellar hook-associated protein 2